VETTGGDAPIEFTNIERDELASLQGYVKGYLEVRAKQAAAATRSVEDRTSEGLAGSSSDAVRGFLNADEDDDSDEGEGCSLSHLLRPQLLTRVTS
jgi:hypothetical protein